MRKRGRRILLAWSIAFGTFTAAQSFPCWAETRIGSATSITNQVQGIVGSEIRTLAAGNDVFSQEVVRTGDASVAQFVFLDKSNLSLGPKSEVRLDRFVYDPDRSTGTVVVRASLGIFRFVTGSLPSQNYSIQTPLLAIGVRGTVFDLLVRPDKVIVVLVSGAVKITTRNNRVVWLTQPGMGVTVLANGRVIGPAEWTSPITDVASNVQFPYFGTLQTAGLALNPVGAAFGHDWTGCYIGGNIGYSWSRARTDTTNPPITTANGDVPSMSYSDSNSLTGLIGGGQVGCNWQPAKNWVFGVETDYQWSGEKGSFERNDPFSVIIVPPTTTAIGTTVIDPDSRISWFGTVRGRAGYLWNNVLLYGTGGLAYGEVKFSGMETVSGCVVIQRFCSPFSQTTSLNGSSVKVGWTLGGGIEAPLPNNWTWKLEYLYIDLGTLNLSNPTPAGTNTITSTKFTNNTVRLGLSYRFAGY